MIYEGVGGGGGVDLIKFAYSTYSERQAWANNVDPDQTPQNAAFDQVYTVYHPPPRPHTHPLNPLLWY